MRRRPATTRRARCFGVVIREMGVKWRRAGIKVPGRLHINGAIHVLAFVVSSGVLDVKDLMSHT